MIKVKPIKLDCILPDDGIGMVIMQPYVELCVDSEPYIWLNEKKDKQIERIIRTLGIAKQADHGCEKTHFTIFPEYSIPGLTGVQKIQEILNRDDWKSGTIVVGGVDGLVKSEYSTLCNDDNTHVHEKNRIDRVPDYGWVNCCIIWTKEPNGTVKRWVQPKLSPSWPEKNITHRKMFAGHSLYVFSARFENQTECRFLSLICFDWIGPIGTKYGIEAVLSEIDNCWSNTRREMNLVFVIQFNPEPNHRNFLENARDYFGKRTEHPFVNRNESLILFANTAGGSLPGKYQNYGYSALISSPLAPYYNRGCPPTFAIMSQKLRGTDSLGRSKEAVFREMGACIHSFRFRLPPFIHLDPTDRCLLIDEAIVHPIDAGMKDARIPGKSVPASVKWVNDQLDEIKPILYYKSGHALKDELAGLNEDISKEFRKSSSSFLCKSIQWAVCGYNKFVNGTRIHDVDNWDAEEKKSLEDIIHSLSIIKVCKQLKLNESNSHASIIIGKNIIDVFVVTGGETHIKCFEYGKQFSVSEQNYVIMITKAAHDRFLHKRSRSILESKCDITDKGPNITDPSERFIHCGYENLEKCCFKAENKSDLNEKVIGVLGI